MIKIGDIYSLNNMVYTDEISDKHRKEMNVPLKHFEGFPLDNFMGNPPSSPQSSKTRNEILKLNELAIDSDFVKECDSIQDYFKEYCKSQDLEFPSDTIKQYMDEMGSMVLALKYLYNRPRPIQVAKHPLVNIPFKIDDVVTGHSPSYPSGHSAQGRFLSLYLSHLYPKHRYNFISLGDDISYSRNVAHIHFPSDSKFGLQLGNEFFKYLLKMRRL